MRFSQFIWKVLLFSLLNDIDILELSLSVPILIKEVVVASQLLCDFSNQLKVLLCYISRYGDAGIVLAQYFNPDQSFSSHNSFHKSEVETPDHDDTEDDSQGDHDYPILDFIDVEGNIQFGSTTTLIISYFWVSGVAICLTVLVSIMLLFQEGVKKQCTLRKCYKQDEQEHVSTNHGEQLSWAKLLTLDIQMIVSFTVLTVYFLCSDYLCCNTVSMNPFVFTYASLDWSITDPQEL